jgi:hypothetical protein
MSTRRKSILFGALALTLFACYWMSSAQDGGASDLALPTERITAPRRELPAGAPSPAAATADQALPLTPPQREDMAVGEQNPFAGKSWAAPIAAAETPPPPPAPDPVAPPLPFTYAGKLEEGSKWIIYLSKGTQSFAVSKGEIFDTNYRLEGIDNGNGNLIILYLPLSTKQLLPTGAELK